MKEEMIENPYCGLQYSTGLRKPIQIHKIAAAYAAFRKSSKHMHSLTLCVWGGDGI